MEVAQGTVNRRPAQSFQGDFTMLVDVQHSLLGAVPLGTDTYILLLFTCQVTLSKQ